MKVSVNQETVVKNETKDMSLGQLLPRGEDIRNESARDEYLAKLIQLSKHIASLKDEGQIEKAESLKSVLDTGLDKLLKDLSNSGQEVSKEVFLGNLDRINNEHLAEKALLKTLATYSDDKLSREQLDEKLDSILNLNRVEAIKIIARLDLEKEALRYAGAVRIIANRRKGDDALRLDLDINLNNNIVGETATEKCNRDSRLRAYEERKEILFKKYEDVLTKDGIDSVCRAKSKEALVELYLSKTRMLPREERRLELIKAGIFSKQEDYNVASEFKATIPVVISRVSNQEKAFWLDVYSKELEQTKERLLQVSFDIGKSMIPGQNGHYESSQILAKSQEERKQLRERLEHLKEEMPEYLPNRDRVKEELKNFNLILADAELQGLGAFNKFQQNQAKKAQEEYQKKAEEGGAYYAAQEIFNNAEDSMVHFSEWAVLNTAGTLSSVKGLVSGKGYETGAEFVEGLREFYNTKTDAGSIFGSDAEFSYKTDWELGLEVSAWGGINHFSNAVISPAFEMVDVGRIQAQRGSGYLGAYIGAAGEDVGSLSFTQYKALEQTDSLLGTAKYSFQVAEIAAGLALGRPGLGHPGVISREGIGALVRNLSVSGGMGLSSAVSTQLMSKEEFSLGQLVEDTLANTAGSQLFSGAMMLGTSAYMRLRAGNILSRLNKGEALLEGEMNFINKTMSQARKFRGGVDFADGQGDLKVALENFKNVGDLNSFLGAIIGAGVATFDAVDVNMGVGHALEKGVSRINEGNIRGVENIELHNVEVHDTRAKVVDEFVGLTVPNIERLDFKAQALNDQPDKSSNMTGLSKIEIKENMSRLGLEFAADSHLETISQIYNSEASHGNSSDQNITSFILLNHTLTPSMLEEFGIGVDQRDLFKEKYELEVKSGNISDLTGALEFLVFYAERNKADLIAEEKTDDETKIFKVLHPFNRTSEESAALLAKTLVDFLPFLQEHFEKLSGFKFDNAEVPISIVTREQAQSLFFRNQVQWYEDTVGPLRNIQDLRNIKKLVDSLILERLMGFCLNGHSDVYLLNETVATGFEDELPRLIIHELTHVGQFMNAEIFENELKILSDINKRSFLNLPLDLTIDIEEIRKSWKAREVWMELHAEIVENLYMDLIRDNNSYENPECYLGDNKNLYAVFDRNWISVKDFNEFASQVYLHPELADLIFRGDGKVLTSSGRASELREKLSPILDRYNLQLGEILILGN